ncbi:MAG: HNH endonuclease [Planctomycetaceae bacterium]|jgi:uncharacterized protein (TIGR02646 family)|nr:HNH endonuclease [Planctomycetaceae bacterium]
MRNIAYRPDLNKKTIQKLEKLKSELFLIQEKNYRKKFAAKKLKRIRQCRWFKNEIVVKLREMSGSGNRCMYCSNSASSDVEHFYPKSAFPEKTFDWENMLWICTSCNRKKGDEFPVNEQNSPLLIDPVSENVWEFFFIDEFGMLSPVFDKSINKPNIRAKNTIETLGLNSEDRNYLCQNRRQAIKKLNEWVNRRIELLESKNKNRQQIIEELKEEKNTFFRPDVVDYFFNGPGKKEEPFVTFFKKLDAFTS